MVQLSVDCYFTSDTLRGDDFSEVEVVLKEIIQERIEKEE
jgi:hypothetical protein